MDALILLTSQTLMILMMKVMLCSYHSRIHGLMKVKVTRVEPPITHCLWPHCGTQPHSYCPAQGPSQDGSHCLAVTGRLTDHGDRSWLQKLNGINTGGMEWGWPGHLGLMCPSVMAWSINHLPLSRLTGLVLSCACLPTHAIIPDNVSMASLASPRLSPSPNDHHP